MIYFTRFHIEYKQNERVDSQVVFPRLTFDNRPQFSMRNRTESIFKILACKVKVTKFSVLRQSVVSQTKMRSVIFFFISCGVKTVFKMSM